MADKPSQLQPDNVPALRILHGEPGRWSTARRIQCYILFLVHREPLREKTISPNTGADCSTVSRAVQDGQKREREGERLDGGAVNELLVELRSSKVRQMDPTYKIVHWSSCLRASLYIYLWYHFLIVGQTFLSSHTAEILDQRIHDTYSFPSGPDTC